MAITGNPTEQVPRFAIIGYAARLPGAADADQYWNLLHTGRDAISEVPQDRWDVDEFFDPDPGAPGKVVTRRAGFVDDVTGFDAPFFGVSTREAKFLDPQHRLLLETAWRAVEHSGTAPTSLANTRTGVFVGLSTHDYLGMASSELTTPRSRLIWQSARPARPAQAGSAIGWDCADLQSPSTRRAARRWWRSIRHARRCAWANATSRWPAERTSCSARPP